MSGPLLYQRLVDDPADPVLAQWVDPTWLWAARTLVANFGMTKRQARRTLRRLERKGAIRPWNAARFHRAE